MSSESQNADSVEQAIGDLQSQVGQRVRKAREAKGLPRRALSDMSGVSQRYLAQLESGQGNISIALLLRVAGALDVTLDQLVSLSTGQGAEFPLVELFAKADPKTQKQVQQLLMPETFTPKREARVALIGLRGAGKTTLGKKAGKKLDLSFVELNTMIEEQSGIALSEVLELYGQEGYRRMEARALQHVIDTEDRLILAVSGGIVAEPETYELLLKHFHTVWLRASPAEHMERVRAQGDTRPMAGNPEAMEQLKRILASREGDYARAEVQLDTSGAVQKDSVNALVKLIKSSDFLKSS